MRQALDEKTLQTLIATGSIREVRCLRKGTSWALEGRLGGYWLPIRSKREPVRLWASLSAIGKFCEGVGVQTFNVEL